MTTFHSRKSIDRSPLRRGFRFGALALVLACCALSPTVRAVDPPPDGGFPNQNTAEGDGALLNLIGFGNTAIGASALGNTINASYNTAVGSFALWQNETGRYNTAKGVSALQNNTTGRFNTANGTNALISNNADNNTATGAGALQSNNTGNNNTADGFGALGGNSSGSKNTANGISALQRNTAGNENTAIGNGALANNTTGSFNIAVGSNAGANLTFGSNNIDIGALGVAGESNTMRIGSVRQTSTFIGGIYGATVPGGVGVIIDSTGHVGTVVSSARFKDEIKPMDKASEAILALKPVTFHYKHEVDPENIPQFGLVAEDVEKINPNLVARDADGKVYTVRYEAINAMLLNEFLKEHRKVQEQDATIAQVKSTAAKQEATIAQQQKQIEALTAIVQKVSDRVQVNEQRSQLVDNQ